MHHEAQVRFVEAHPQRGGGHERLDLVVQQRALQFFAFARIGASGVRAHPVSGGGEELGHILGRRDGQAVDDPAALQRLEVLHQPGGPLLRVVDRDHREVQRLAVEAAAEHQGVRVARRTRGPRRAHAQLLGDIPHHPVVGRGGGGQHGHALGEVGQQCPDSPVVGPEIVTPIRHAVRLVDHHESRIGGQRRQDGVPEVRVVEPLGAHEQHIHLAGPHRRPDLVPLGHVGRVDGGRPHPGPCRGLDLVTHQRQQRRDDHRRTGAQFAQQACRDEIDGRLAPAGALHDQRTTPIRDQRLDGRPLVLAQPRARTGEGGQQLIRPGSQGRAVGGGGADGSGGGDHDAHRAPDLRQCRAGVWTALSSSPVLLVRPRSPTRARRTVCGSILAT